MNDLKSFTLYEEYFELVTLLPEDEQGDILLAICNYMFYGIEPELKEKSLKVFKNLKRPLDVSKKQSINGLKGGAPMGNSNAKKQPKNNPNNNPKTTQTTTQSTTQKQAHQDVYVYVNVDEDNKGVIGGEEETTDEADLLVEIVNKVISHLNEKANTNYRTSSKSTKQKINARLNEGYCLDDFIAVIDKKYAEWIGTEFEQYLCPETLFGTKFEKYLNARTPNKNIDEKWGKVEIAQIEEGSKEYQEMENLMKDFKKEE